MSTTTRQVVETVGFSVPESPSGGALPHLLVVGGGKGGVGKTCFAVNVGVEIARRGWRVVILDADLTCSNAETMLGMRADRRLDDFFERKRGVCLQEIACETPYENLRLIPGASGLLDAANPRYRQRDALVQGIRALDADLVIIDLDAGARLNSLDLYLQTLTHGVLIITPERTSIDNAFKFLRAAVYRHIERFYGVPEVGVLLKRHESLRGFLEFMKTADCFDRATRKVIERELLALARAFRPRIVVNKVQNAYEAQVAAQIMAKHARDHLLSRPESLGFIYFDHAVSEAVNSGVPFVIGRPRLRVSGCVVDMANRLGYF
ncbi:MAG TPA: P-loop NTPase [Candidatus Hydrogenedentes bacterium]|nr:P-loop NTPase [Candidatus Hydrogenedentota bacterium]